MSVVSAFLVPGSPLPLLKSSNPPWSALAEGYTQARTALAASEPDVLLVYSTQWLAVLDQLWQARPHLNGLHVDEEWYEFGDLEMDIRCDVELARECVEGCRQIGVKAKAVDYDAFPVDSGTIVANTFLNPDGRLPMVIASNNLYHDGALTETLAAMAVEKAATQGKRVAVLAVGGLSSAYFDHEIDISDDRICDDEYDRLNREFLAQCQAGGKDRLRAALPAFAESAKADMGMKHLHWLLGAIDEFHGAIVHAYGPTYGAGSAVVEFKLNG